MIRVRAGLKPPVPGCFYAAVLAVSTCIKKIYSVLGSERPQVSQDASCQGARAAKPCGLRQYNEPSHHTAASCLACLACLGTVAKELITTYTLDTV